MGKKIHELDTVKIARERIAYLFNLARETFRNDPELAVESISVMERIALRFDITLPQEIKRFYCKKCKNPYSGYSKLRLYEGMMEIRCHHCGNIRRIPYK